MSFPSDLDPTKLPRHVAIIMDGNGRWAVQQGKDRIHGHRRGARTVVDLVEDCVNLRNAARTAGSGAGPDFLTLYSFSVENWKRPAAEVEALMQLYIDFLSEQREVMMANNVRYNQIGRTQELPDPVIEEMNRSLEATKNNTGLTLTLAINYGARTEITDAVRAIAQKVQAGQLDPRDISPATIDQHLYTGSSSSTSPIPDVDLLIRTAGELRISNYLLWQISYAELVVTDRLWPDFTESDFHDALRQFSRRNRRFGALDHTNTLKK